MHALSGSSVLAHQTLFHLPWEYRALATVQAGYLLPGEQLCWKDAGSKLSDSLCSRNKVCSRNKDTQKHPELYQHKIEWSNYSPFLFRPNCGSESSLGLPSTGKTWANWRKFREGTSVWSKLGHLLRVEKLKNQGWFSLGKRQFQSRLAADPQCSVAGHQDVVRLFTGGKEALVERRQIQNRHQ